MKPKTRLLPFGLTFAAASLLLLPALPARAANGPDTPAQGSAAPAKAAPTAAAKPAEAAKQKAAEAAAPPQQADRAQAYYHLALADIYEEEAFESGKPEYAGFAVEEYKKALNADPGSAELYNGLAELYFRTGRVREAEVTARELLKVSPDNMDAHKLLGRIYLRQLDDGQNAVFLLAGRQCPGSGHCGVREDGRFAAQER